jgi:hypothetical protein
MSLITKAQPAAPLTLQSTQWEMFRTAGVNDTGVCFLPIPAATGLDLTLLDVTATGTVEANQPGTIQIGLYAYVTQPNQAPPDGDSAHWILLGASPAEPIGAADDHAKTSWMVQGTDLMFNLANGKMQGGFQSNVADAPVFPADLNTNPNNIRSDVSPVMYFAVGAQFTPDADDGSKPELEMANFILSGQI